MVTRRNCFNDARRRNPPRSPGAIASSYQHQQLPLPSGILCHGRVNGLSLQRPLPQWPTPAQDIVHEPVDLVGQIVADIFSERHIEERMIDTDGDVDAVGLGEATDDMYLEAETKLLFCCNQMGVDLDAIALPHELRQSLFQRLHQGKIEEDEAEEAHDQLASVSKPQPEPESEPERPQPIPPAFLLPMPPTPMRPPMLVNDIAHTEQQQQQQQQQQRQRQQRQPATTTKSCGTGKATSDQTVAAKPKADPNRGMARAKTSAGGMIQNSTRPQRSAPPTSKPPTPRAHASAAAPAPAAVPAPASDTTVPKPAEATTTLDADGDSEMDDASEPAAPTIAAVARALSPSTPPPVMIELDNDVHMSNSSATTHPFLPHLGLDPREGVNAALRMVRNCGDWCAWLRAELELALEQVLRQRQRMY